MRLYEIASELGAVATTLEDMDPDPQTPAAGNEADLWAHWQALDVAFERKVEVTALLGVDHEAHAEKCKAEIRRLATSKASSERTIEALKGLLRQGFKEAKRKRVDCDRIKVRTQPCPPSTDVYEPAAVPAEYLRKITISIPLDSEAMQAVVDPGSDLLATLEAMGATVLREVDAAKAKGAIKDGVVVPGVTLKDAPDSVVWW